MCVFVCVCACVRACVRSLSLTLSLSLSLSQSRARARARVCVCMCKCMCLPVCLPVCLSMSASLHVSFSRLSSRLPGTGFQVAVSGLKVDNTIDDFVHIYYKYLSKRKRVSTIYPSPPPSLRFPLPLPAPPPPNLSQNERRTRVSDTRGDFRSSTGYPGTARISEFLAVRSPIAIRVLLTQLSRPTLEHSNHQCSRDLLRRVAYQRTDCEPRSGVRAATRNRPWMRLGA